MVHYPQHVTAADHLAAITTLTNMSNQGRSSPPHVAELLGSSANAAAAAAAAAVAPSSSCPRSLPPPPPPQQHQQHHQQQYRQQPHFVALPGPFPDRELTNKTTAAAAYAPPQQENAIAAAVAAVTAAIPKPPSPPLPFDSRQGGAFATNNNDLDVGPMTGMAPHTTAVSASTTTKWDGDAPAVSGASLTRIRYVTPTPMQQQQQQQQHYHHQQRQHQGRQRPQRPQQQQQGALVPVPGYAVATRVSSRDSTTPTPVPMPPIQQQPQKYHQHHQQYDQQQGFVPVPPVYADAPVGAHAVAAAMDAPAHMSKVRPGAFLPAGRLDLSLSVEDMRAKVSPVLAELGPSSLQGHDDEGAIQMTGKFVYDDGGVDQQDEEEEGPPRKYIRPCWAEPLTAADVLPGIHGDKVGQIASLRTRALNRYEPPTLGGPRLERAPSQDLSHLTNEEKEERRKEQSRQHNRRMRALQKVQFEGLVEEVVMKNHFMTVIEDAPNCVIVLSPDKEKRGTIRFANKAMRQFLELPPQWVDGSSLLEMVHPSDRPTVSKLMDSAAEQHPNDAKRSATIYCRLQCGRPFAGPSYKPFEVYMKNTTLGIYCSGSEVRINNN